MIRIVKGTFGFAKGQRVVALTSASGDVDLGDSALEARLVDEGMAVYASKTPKKKTAAPTLSNPPTPPKTDKNPTYTEPDEQPPTLSTAAPV